MAMPAGTCRAQRRQRGTDGAKRSRQVGADAAGPQPSQTAHRLGQRRAAAARRAAAPGAKRAGRRHRLNILPGHGCERSRGRAPPRCGRGRAGAAPDGGTARAALAARRGGPSPGRAPGADARRARARARLGRRPGRRPRGAAAALSEGRDRRRRARRVVAGARRAIVRAALVAARPRACVGPCRRRARRRAGPRPARLGQHGAARRASIRRRCSRAGTALLAVDGFVAFSCLGPGTLAELRELYAALGWPAPTPGFIDMHDLGDMLVAAGFADPVLDQETLTLSWASAEALLARAAPARRQRRARSLRRPAHAGVAAPPARGARGARRRRRPHRARLRDRLRPRVQGRAARSRAATWRCRSTTCVRWCGDPAEPR